MDGNNDDNKDLARKAAIALCLLGALLFGIGLNPLLDAINAGYTSMIFYALPLTLVGGGLVTVAIAAVLLYLLQRK